MAYHKNLKLSLISALALSVALASPVRAEKASVDLLLEQMQPSPAATPVKPSSSPAVTLKLHDALAVAYNTNPELKAARAELRAVDERYVQAVSGYRPTVSGETSYVSSYTDSDTRTTSADPKTLSVEVVQPLYRGGATDANVKASDFQIKAQRALLHVKEQEVMLSGVSAYLAIIRDREIVRLNQNNENVLKKNLEAARQRFKLGDITKTDVSQSESRLAQAVAQRVAAEGELKKSRATFERVFGLPPDNIIEPTETLTLPAGLDAALSEAESHNPTLAYAKFTSAAQEASTRAIKGELLPQIDLSGSVGRTYDPSSTGDDYEDDRRIALRATVPFFSGGGSTYSRIRQSRQIESQRRLEINDSERAVRQEVISAWEELAAADARKRARDAQVEAAQTALNGVKLEADYGSRTTLDLLDAEQEYLDAQVASVTALHDKIVASYGLLASVGALTAERLQLAVSAYDPDKNFQNVKNKWFGGRIDPVE